MTTRIRTTITSSSGAMILEKRGISRWDFRDPYHFALTLTWPEFFTVLVVLYGSINLAFALAYFELPGSIAKMPPRSFLDAFFFSVETLATVGYGVMAPTTLAGHLVATLEIFVGMMFTATMTGLAFVRFSRPKAKILFADRMVVSGHGPRRTLMVRFGNGRAYAMTDTIARVNMLLVEFDENGQMYRRVVDLKLRRSDFPFFPLTLTLMHEIDEQSPLHGLGEDEFRKKNPRIMLSVSARDPELGAQVHASQGYQGADIAFGMRYADAVSWDGGDMSVADMGRISDVEPDTAASAGLAARSDGVGVD